MAPATWVYGTPEMDDDALIAANPPAKNLIDMGVPRAEVIERFREKLDQQKAELASLPQPPARVRDTSANPPLSEWLHRCREARAQGQNIPEASLFRRMLSHDAFFTNSMAYPEETDTLGGVHRIVDVYCAHGLTQGDVRQWDNGLHLAGVLKAETKEMRLFFEFGSGPLILSAEEVEHFRSFLQVNVVESILQKLHGGEDMSEMLDRLRDFDSFLTVCAGAPGGIGPLKMALATDVGAEGRKLAAVFTAQDALQLFIVSRQGSGGDELISVRLSGVELFTQLMESAEIDGMVFNPCGPITPFAFAKEVAATVLGS